MLSKRIAAKKLLTSFIFALLLMFGSSVLLPAGVSAADPTDAAKAQVCQGVGTQAGGKCGNGGDSLNKIIGAVLNVISVIGGLVAVIMIIVSGIKYTTSGGDAQAVAGAKRSLIYAIVGLIIVALSQTIVFFVVGKLN